MRAPVPPPAWGDAWAVPNVDENGAEFAAGPDEDPDVETPPFFRRRFDAVEDSASAVDPAPVCPGLPDFAVKGPTE